jgi:3D (Asp-Asp-Asp) domain-containing protein
MILPKYCNCEAKAKYEKSKPKTEWVCIGTFKITAYNYNEGGGENYSTASGRTPVPYYTVATDPDIILLGTKFKIEGLGIVRSDDTGGAINGNIIDYHIGYDSCDSFGIKYRKVFVKKTWNYR